MKRISSLVRIVIIVCVFIYSNSFGSPNGDSILWKAVRDAKTIYVLGVTHTGFQIQYPIRKEISESFKKSSVYVTESELPYLSSNQAIEDALFEKFQATSGQTLQTLVADKKCNVLAANENFQANLNELLGPETVKQLMMGSPRAAIFTVFTKAPMVPQDQLNEMKLAESLELYFSKQAKTLGVRRDFLDPEFWDAIDSLSTGDMCNLAIGMTTIRSAKDFDKNHGADLMQRQVALWLKGDSEKLEESSFFWPRSYASTHADAEYKWMILRNKFMVKKILTIDEKESSPIFVAVGAAHLSGKAGILSQLRDAGFNVSPL